MGTRKADGSRPQADPPPDLVLVGLVIGSWGRAGGLKIRPLTDFPDRLPSKGSVWLWRPGIEPESRRVTGGRMAGGKVVLELEGIQDVDRAEGFRGYQVLVDRDRLEPLPLGSFYRFQIIGLAVRTPAGRDLGRVAEIWPGGPHDVYVVRGEAGEVLLPAVKEFIRSVDLDAGLMIADPHEGERDKE